MSQYDSLSPYQHFLSHVGMFPGFDPVLSSGLAQGHNLHSASDNKTVYSKNSPPQPLTTWWVLHSL